MKRTRWMQGDRQPDSAQKETLVISIHVCGAAGWRDSVAAIPPCPVSLPP